MSFNGRLSAALHALLHLAEHHGPMTSEALAASLRTNPVVVRQTMAGLRGAGIVRSVRGHGGGWHLMRDVASLTVADVYAALGAPAMRSFATGDVQATCLVERTIARALDRAALDAQALLVERFSAIPLAAMLAEFHAWASSGAATEAHARAV